MTNGTNMRGRPCREWLDDMADIGIVTVYRLNSQSSERRKWTGFARQSISTCLAPKDDDDNNITGIKIIKK
jgi:hypothetical protein